MLFPLLSGGVSCPVQAIKNYMKVRVIIIFDVFASLLLSMPAGADGSVAFMHYVIALSRAERAVKFV